MVNQNILRFIIGLIVSFWLIVGSLILLTILTPFVLVSLGILYIFLAILSVLLVILFFSSLIWYLSREEQEPPKSTNYNLNQAKNAQENQQNNKN